ncbi:hypothetical protein [Methylobacterium iners]|uniref:STAS/SEC14 domain-containing protein n=1 Tax=Methylobacterium iners TaxID=418707 RepID=A0ABQ4S4S5_9HYPH|nr:hypothetical protein [Methylobacterium iners]GJD98079.1 hypothetical protein OCOJLMKI_5318 [Methylobacterium iners]
MSLRLRPVRVAIGSNGAESQLVFADDALVAVLVQLSEAHEDEAGMWFLEAGFGRAEAIPQPSFATLDEAQSWIERRLGKA